MCGYFLTSTSSVAQFARSLEGNRMLRVDIGGERNEENFCSWVCIENLADFLPMSALLHALQMFFSTGPYRLLLSIPMVGRPSILIVSMPWATGREVVYLQTDMLWSVELEQDNATNSLTLPLEHVRYGSDHSLEYVQMVAFVDRVFPSFVTKYVQGG